MKKNNYTFCYIVCWLALLFSCRLYAEPKLPFTVAKIKPSIVAVGTFMPARNPRAVFLGTGFVVGDGSLVVTNAHVIPSRLDDRHLEQVSVFYRKGDADKVIATTLVAVDETHDLAILKISGATLPPLKLGDVATVREGQLYAFTGFPIGMVLGLYPVTHRGIVSAITPNVIPMLPSEQLDVKMLRKLAAPFNVFQLDATAYPGNSGSPLYNPDTGGVVGVINKVFIQEGKEHALSNPSGISYAIPADYVIKLLKDKNLR